MPGAELEGRIHELYELDNYSRQPQVADGNWPGYNYNQWHESLREISEPLRFGLRSNTQQLVSVRGHGDESLNPSYDQGYTHLTQRPEFSNIQHGHQHLKTNDYMLGRDILQANHNQSQFFGESAGFTPHNLGLRGLSIFKSEQEYASCDSPTLTTNSERSEITEASNEINFIERQQQFVRGQQGITPHHPMQQSGYNEMQLLQQHPMFKQFQELQRQQQLQQLGDSRHQNSVNQLSAVAKQASGVQLSPFINGTPINDTPQMLMNGVQRGASPTGQNVFNRVGFSQDQGQNDESSAMLMNGVQRGASPTGQNVFNRVGFSMAQAPQQFDASLYGTPINSGRGMMSQFSQLQSGSQDSVNLLTKASNQVQKPDGQASAFTNSYAGDHCTTSNQGFLPQGAFISKQGFQGENMFGQVTVQGLNSTLGNLQQGSSFQTNTSQQELNGKQEQDGWPGISQNNTMQHGLIPLDPMEEKILYTDDGLWDPSLANCNDIGGGGLGSWSALMQSAVADSSSETGMHEEWSGLSFQNTELPSCIQPSNMLDSEKQQGSWADNNLQTASSYSSKLFPMLNDSTVSSSFPGFQQPDIQFKPEHRGSLQRDESHESSQRSPRSNNKWLDHNAHQQVQQTHEQSDSLWINQRNEPSECDAPHQRIDPYSIAQPGQLEKLQSSSEDTLKNRQNAHMFNFPSVANTHIINHQGTRQQVPKNIYQQSSYQEDNSVGPSGVLTTGTRSLAHGSQNMLELLNKADRLKENISVTQFYLSGSNQLSEMTYAKSPVASDDQIYSQTSASQGFALNFAQPSQRHSTSNSQFSPQGLPSDSHSQFSPHRLPQPARQVDSDLGEKNQTFSAASPTSQSLSRSHESSPRNCWDDKFSSGGQSSIPQSYMHGNSIAEITSSPTFRRNQIQAQGLFNPHASAPSRQATSPATATGHQHGNRPQSEDSSQQTFVNCDGQQFPILESVPVFHPGFKSGMPSQGGVPFRPHSAWTNKGSLQSVSGMEPQKVPTVLPSNGSMRTAPSTLNELNSLISQQGGGHLQGSDSPEEKRANEKGQKPLFSGMLEPPQTEASNVSDSGVLSSGSLLANSNLQDLGRIHNGDNNGLSPTARNLQLIGHALNPSNGLRPNYTLLQKMQAMKNLVNNPSGREMDVQQALVMTGQQSVYGHSKDGKLISESHPKSLSFGSTNVPSSLSEAREDQSIRASPQSAPQAQTPMVGFGQTHSQSQYDGSNGTAADASRANLFMAANWLKQYGSLRNGQVPLMQDARTAAGQFSLFKPSQSLNTHLSVDQIDASDANQSSKVWPGTAVNFVPSEPLIAPCELNSNAINQGSDMLRPKKRKIALCEQPWHKVMQGFKEVQDFSTAEEEWASASNRLIEKVPGDFGMIDVLPRFRAKRRLIFSTQAMQHLLGPAPASFLAADAALHYDSVTYFVAKLSLGDACSLTYSKRNSNVKQLNDKNMIVDKPKVPESDDDLLFSKVVEHLTEKSKKLENELLRLDKAVSFLDVRLECQELERFSVINRFAKFHLPHADMSGASSASGTLPNASRPSPQRYVTGKPLPKNLPEEVQCLQL